MKGPYKKFAQEFLPPKVRYLLIGESPPCTPPNEGLRYFYNYRNNTGRQILLSSVSYSFLNKKFYSKRDNKEEYLKELMRQRIFLLDATYEPINQIKDRKRREIQIKNERRNQKLTTALGLYWRGLVKKDRSRVYTIDRAFGFLSFLSFVWFL
jgi:hypothetical protein